MFNRNSKNKTKTITTNQAPLLYMGKLLKRAREKERLMGETKIELVMITELFTVQWVFY